jgi:DNA recombination protein RmuC
MAQTAGPLFDWHNLLGSLYGPLTLATGLLAGAGLMWLWRRGYVPPERRKLLEEQTQEIADLTLRLDERQSTLYELKTRIAVADEKASRIPSIESENRSHIETIRRLTTDLQTHIAASTAYEQQVGRIPKLESALAEASARAESLVEELRQQTAARARAEQEARRVEQLEKQVQEQAGLLEQLHNANTELQTRMAAERKSTEEKLAMLRNAESQLITQFENLANRVLDEKSKRFAEQNRNHLDGVLHPFREQLGEFKRKVDDMQIHDAKDRASLKQEIQHLRVQTQQINQEAINLTRALKGDKKLQGTWGELVLERVLEQSGLRKGIEYETQGGFRDTDNRLLRPDVIIRLPEGKDIVIDSKVSLRAYEQYASTEDTCARDSALKEHIQAVRNHIKALSGKDYSSLNGVRTLDFILMFMPIEPAFILAFQQDEGLFSDAFQSKIVVVTPTTLLGTLRTIENIWRYERQNENARIIAAKAATVYEKLRGFLEDLARLGSQLDTVHKTYDEVMQKLTHGRGNLIRQAHSFAELGVKVTKALPKTFLDQGVSDADSESPRLQIIGSQKPEQS